MIIKYKEYLNFLDSKLKNIFTNQAPFIKCKKGCALCCHEGEYPMSELEFIYLMMGLNELNNKTKEIILGNINKLISQPKQKYYICPFLLNENCSVYEFRSIICRTFGLIYYDSKGKKKVPFCIDKGLNYSGVFDKDTDKIVKCAPDGTEPLAYNVGREFLRNKSFEKEFQVFFGDDKTLYEWLQEEFQ